MRVGVFGIYRIYSFIRYFKNTRAISVLRGTPTSSIVGKSEDHADIDESCRTLYLYGLSARNKGAQVLMSTDLLNLGALHIVIFCARFRGHCVAGGLLRIAMLRFEVLKSNTS